MNVFIYSFFGLNLKCFCGVCKLFKLFLGGKTNLFLFKKGKTVFFFKKSLKDIFIIAQKVLFSPTKLNIVKLDIKTDGSS